MQSHLRFIAAATIILLACPFATRAQRHRHEDERNAARHGMNPCYDPGDPNDILLWRMGAPGAMGSDPCRDVPYLQVFRSAEASHEPRPAVLIIPGGGYDRLTDAREQVPVAEYFVSQLHVTAFILRYRLVQGDGTYRYPIPFWDGQRALRLLRAQSAALGINPNHVAVFGFSAGGHLASTLALHPSETFGAVLTDAIDRSSARVDLLGLGYPVISMNPAAVPPSGSYRNLLGGLDGRQLRFLQHFLSGEENVTPKAPPTFLFESLDDRKISPLNSQLFAEALQRAGVPNEVHIFRHGEHGAGLAEGVPEEDAWPSMFQTWIARYWPETGRAGR